VGPSHIGRGQQIPRGLKPARNDKKALAMAQLKLRPFKNATAMTFLTA
jgi:hypothetical protein